MEHFYSSLYSAHNMNLIRTQLVQQHGIPEQMVRDKDVMDMVGRAITAYGPVVEGNLWYLDVQDAGGPQQFFEQKRHDVNRMVVYELNQAIKSAYALDRENQRTNIDWQHREIVDHGVSDRPVSLRKYPLQNYSHYW